MTTRQEREFRSLSPEMFKVHELSFEQLLVWAQQFAQLLPFRDQNDQAAGNWGTMFEQNELVVCAMILSVDLKAHKRQFKQTGQLSQSTSIDYILQFYQLLERWYTYLPNSPEIAYQLRLTLLTEYQSTLAEPLKRLLNNMAQTVRPNTESFDSLWQLDRVDSELNVNAVATTNDIELSQHCFSKLSLAISRLQKQCRKLISESLSHQQHAPQLALYVSFLKLFERAQKQVNQFTRKHMLFYYQDVLKQSKKPIAESQVFLKLSQNPVSQSPAIIKGGEIFSPGNNSKFQRIDYQAAYSIEVTDAEVSQLFHLTFKRDHLVSPERETGFVSGVNGHRVHLDPSSCGSKLSAAQRSAFFANHKHSAQSDIQTIGMIIADPILATAEGQREFSLHFALKEVDGGLIYQQLAQINANHIENNAQDQSINHTLIQIFEQLLTTHKHTITAEFLGLSAQKLADTLSHEQRSQLLTQSTEQRFSTVYRYFFLALLSKIQASQTQFFRVFGQLICRHALHKDNWLTSDDIKIIRTKAEELKNNNQLDAISLETIENILSSSTTTLFYQLFQDIFELEITTEKGWMNISHAQTHPFNTERDGQMGFTLNWSLSHEFPATCVLAEESNNSQSFSHPALKMSLRTQTNCFPYSILRDFEFSQVQIESDVKEVTRLELFNQDGQADPSQPFFPFGTQPNDESYLVIASEEVARKNLKELTVNLDWADLPRGSDGFRQHYAQYPFNYNNGSFKVSTEVLSKGQWQSLTSHSQALFQPPNGPLEKRSQLHVSRIQNSYTPVTSTWSQTPFSPHSNIRNGLFKLQLIGPSVAFGHREFGPLFSQILTQNAKRKTVEPLPNAPYTPLVNRLSIDYKATTTIDPLTIEQTSQTQIIQLHPFGSEQIYPTKQHHHHRRPRLLANYCNDSHIFIGLTATDLSGYLNLFFLFAGNAKFLSPYPSTQYQWHYLVGNEWVELAASNLIHDTTQGFLTSGVVTLYIPDEIDTCHHIMPDGMYWLKVSTNVGIDRYPDCLHVATHVLRVNGLGSLLEEESDTLPPFSQWQHYPKQAELGQISQLTAIQYSQPEETDQQWRMRVSETLRHKGKAVTPWDYEHLVLENFTQVGAVNCFPCQTFDQRKPTPGHVLVTVTANQKPCQHAPCEPRELDSATLLSIRGFLASLSRKHAHIEVRNPGYETIQVRCRVRFREGVHHGIALRRLQYSIQQALCPWHENSLNQGLGWELSLTNLSAYIRCQNDVAAINDLSVIKISHDQKTHYGVEDSATTKHSIQPEYPWYMLIPAKQHYIQIDTDINIDTSINNSQPVPAGIGNLEIGEQFVITSSSSPITGSRTLTALSKGGKN